LQEQTGKVVNFRKCGLNWLTVLIVLFSINREAYSFVPTKNSSGKNLKWPKNITSIPIYINTSNPFSLTSSEVKSIAANSVASWDENVGPSIALYETSSASSSGQNDIFFTNNTLYFADDGIVAVTKLSYKTASTEISEADILINNNATEPDTNSLMKEYLGNILAHEFGHFVGLGHEQDIHSTMFYKLNYGQHKLNDIDISSVNTLYNSSAYPGIYGKIVGGKSLLPIFGAIVTAYNMNTGKIASSSITEEDGSFALDGLAIGQNYFLTVGPSKNLSVLPDYYKSARNDFCDGRTPYRMGLFSTCFSENIGYAQVITISSNQDYNLGYISIACDFKVPEDYLGDKTSSSGFQAPAVDAAGNVGIVAAGYVSSADASASGYTEKIEFDLSNYSLPSGSTYLDVKVIYHSLGSPLLIEAELSRTGASTISFPTLVGSVVRDPSDGAINFDLRSRIQLDSSNRLNNKVVLTLSPQLMKDHLSTSLWTIEDVIPEFSTYSDALGVYFVVANLVQYKDGEWQTVKGVSNSQIYDNSRCPMGSNTYTVTKSKAGALLDQSTGKSSKNEDEALPIGCGSIEGPSNGEGGPLSNGIALMLGMLVAIAMTKLSKIKTHIG